MEKKKREKIENAVEQIQSRMENSAGLPDVLLDRVLEQGALSVFILAAGILTGIQMQAWNFVFWSVALSGYCGYKAVRLFRIAEKGRYETVEGSVVQIQGRHGLGRLYKLHVKQKDGKETTLLMDKGNKVQLGKAYRFYFSSSKRMMSGIGGLDAALNTDAFYGLEELEEWNA